MRWPARLGVGYVFFTSMFAAVAGRLMDRSGVLPGVHEAVSVRAGHAAWLACLLAACLVGIFLSRFWSSGHDLRRTAVRACPLQMAVFLVAEATSRLAVGKAPLDPDALTGATMQAALALVLLLVLAAGWFVFVRRAPAGLPSPSLPPSQGLRWLRWPPALRIVRDRSSRGPPAVARLRPVPTT